MKEKTLFKTRSGPLGFCWFPCDYRRALDRDPSLQDVPRRVLCQPCSSFEVFETYRVRQDAFEANDPERRHRETPRQSRISREYAWHLVLERAKC